MKKLIAMIMALTMVVGLAACGQSKNAAEAGTEAASTDKDTWVMAINATFPPFESIDEGTDNYVGIDIDIANHIAEKLGKKLEIKDMQFSALVPTMESGRADIIISGISPTAERKEVLDFTDSYYFPMNAIICAKGADYKELSDLEGKSIGVSMGTSYAEVAKSVAGAEVKELDSTPLVVQDILSGRCDAGIFDATQAAVFVQENEGLETHIINSDITMEDTFAIALPKGSEYVEPINEILAEMMEDGTMHEILEKYMGTDAASQYEEMISTLDIAK